MTEPVHRHLPDTRKATTHKFRLEGHKGYLTVGTYDDATLGEMFLSMAKEGSTLSGMADAFAISISIGLQHGVPLKAYTDKFIGVRFEPMGRTENPAIPEAKSIIDYIFRWLALKFIPDHTPVPVLGDES